MFHPSRNCTSQGTPYADVAAILEALPANVAYVDADLVYRFVNQAYETLFGRRREELLGRRVEEVLGPSAFAIAEPRLRKALSGELFSYESEFEFPGRQPCWLVVHYIPDRPAATAARGVYVFAVDISRRRAVEAQLLRSELRYQLLYDCAPIGIVQFDRECRVQRLNNRAAEEFGTLAKEALGRTLEEILGREVGRPFVERQRAVLATATAAEFIDEVELDGARKWYLSTYAPVPGLDGEDGGLQIVSRDITALKDAERASREAEERLRQAQRLQAIGALAGGVAHDFNNILQTILSFSGEILDDADLAGQHREDLGIVRDACRRGASLTAQMLAFSRQQKLSPRAFDIHESMTSLFKMISRLLGEDVSLSLDLAAGESEILADEGQFAQIILNLVVNARDAMAEGGRLTVSTTNRLLEASAGDELDGGRYVAITVRDTGCGIRPEDLDRIYEPFFTTKEFGHGTGLGLATVFGIVKQHRGQIKVASVPGEGTAFEVCLPVRTESAREPDCPSRVTGPGREETILLAEDDPDVRSCLARTLRRAGYRVLTAVDGMEAVALHREHSRHVRLAVMDSVMPGCSGEKALATMRVLVPELRAVILSGYPSGPAESAAACSASTPLLFKPISGDELCTTVRRLLDEVMARP